MVSQDGAQPTGGQQEAKIDSLWAKTTIRVTLRQKTVALISNHVFISCLGLQLDEKDQTTLVRCSVISVSVA